MSGFHSFPKMVVFDYTQSPAEAEYDGLTAGFETIQLRP